MRTVFPQKKFPSLNPDYVFGSNTAGNFTPPYTGYYYMRAVGGGGSSSLKSDVNECVAGGGGGGYDGQIFLKGGDVISYSVGIGGAAASVDNWGNNGADTIFGNIVLGGGYGGNIGANGGRGGSAGMYKGGLAYYYKIDPAYSTFLGHYRETPESDGVLFGGGAGLTFFHSDANSHFDYLANACGKNGRSKSLIDSFLNQTLKRGGSTVFGVSSNIVWDGSVPALTNFGTGGDLYFPDGFSQAGRHGRIEIWRLQ